MRNMLVLTLHNMGSVASGVGAVLHLSETHTLPFAPPVALLIDQILELGRGKLSLPRGAGVKWTMRKLAAAAEVAGARTHTPCFFVACLVRPSALHTTVCKPRGSTAPCFLRLGRATALSTFTTWAARR